MARTDIPSSDLRGTSPAELEKLEQDLAASVDGEVRFDAGTRGAYSTDGSNFRQVPIGVVLPRTVEAGAATVAVCRAHGVPLLSRGGGTSLAGQCTNTAVVIDWSKYCDRVLEVDAEQRTCVVEPGIVLDVLNDQLKPAGLRFGPEPATHMNCTLGGMIGNNSCGATAQRTGKVVDNIAALEVLLYDGTRFWCGPTSDDEFAAIERRGDQRARIYRRLRQLRDTYGDQIRATYPDIPRRVSGYNLDSLLPEHGFDVAGLLVGSESTLVTVLRAKLKLVDVLTERSLVVLGYPSVDKAGLAGNFGFQRGHGEMSRALAERALLPRLRSASSGAVVLADGFSCRTQIHELDSGGRDAMHLAELLATAGALDYERPEAAAAPRPADPSPAARAAVLAGAASLAGACAAAAIWALTRRGTRR